MPTAQNLPSLRCLTSRGCTASLRFLLFLVLTASVARAQDGRALEHTDYDRWNRLGATQISNDGDWISFSISSAKPDSESKLVVRDRDAAKQYEIQRGTGAQFTFDSKYLVYRVTPEKSRIEALKKAKVADDELPQPHLEVLELASGKRITVPGVSSFRMPRENGRWLAYLRESTKAEQLKQSKSEVTETYEVTPSGLQKPEPKQKLKPRRESEFAMPDPKKAESKSATKSKSKGEQGASEKSEKSKDGDAEKPENKKKSTGQLLVLHDLQTGLQRSYPYVTQFAFDKRGTRLGMIMSVVADTSQLKTDDDASQGKSTGDKTESAAGLTDGVQVVDLGSLKLATVQTGVGEYKGLEFNEDGTRLAWLSNHQDYRTKTPSWSVYHWKSGAKSAELAVQESSAGIPQGWWISPNASLAYSEDNRRLYFDTAPVPEDVEKERREAEDRKAGRDTKPEPPQAKLDLWHWQDPQLQPQQLIRAAAELRRDYRAAFQLKNKRVTQLATREIPSIRIDPRSPSQLAAAVSDMPYRKMMSWDLPGFQDTYLVDLNTGEHERVLEKSRASGSLSPDGKFLTWYDPVEKAWFAISTAKSASREPVNISEGVPHPLYDELHDTPSLPSAYGSPGWLMGDQAMLIYDRYDVWQLDPTGKETPVCLTEGQGRKQKIRFRGLRLDPEARAIDPQQPIYLTAFNETTKSEGFYQLSWTGDAQVGKSSKTPPAADEAVTLKRLMMLDESLGRLTKARDSDAVMFTRSTFRMFPDVWTSTLKFEKVRRISDANPQQDEYRWGTAELVEWKSADGKPLEGLLYKPDDFDPTRQYPLMVYFYERNSDNLHRYYTPEAGRSIINFSFYVSRGYVIFVPDIPYRTGEPGPSAANAILPGVEHLVSQGFIDRERIGMQGHSWGGYQTAYLVTQTDMFACAESGAPVSNMTSAYGGIRWSSGMSRMFQYEKTQSRIGGDLWNARDKYIANSPVFFADKVNTPLLILHNDEDGAVPWYQGIEMFVALRRLEKPAWLLNYNGDPHWVMGDANRLDFAKRMQQFFDHYLMDAPEPEWMAYGIPAIDKGQEFGFDLLEPKSESKPEPSENEGE